MKIGSGIAIAGIWIAVAVASCCSEGGIMIAPFAVIGTLFVCMAS